MVACFFWGKLEGFTVKENNRCKLSILTTGMKTIFHDDIKSGGYVSKPRSLVKRLLCGTIVI